MDRPRSDDLKLARTTPLVRLPARRALRALACYGVELWASNSLASNHLPASGSFLPVRLRRGRGCSAFVGAMCPVSTSLGARSTSPPPRPDSWKELPRVGRGMPGAPPAFKSGAVALRHRSPIFPVVLRGASMCRLARHRHGSSGTIWYRILAVHRPAHLHARPPLLRYDDTPLRTALSRHGS